MKNHHKKIALVLFSIKTSLSASMGSPLIDAAMEGEIAQVQTLLDGGAEIDATGTRNVTALIAAATHGKLEAVQLLVERGANVNAYADYYGTALFTAYGHIHRDVVKYLLSQGADPNIAKEGGFTLLMSAALHGDAEMVKLLLERGANRNLKQDDGSTALKIATSTFKTRQKNKELNEVLAERYKESIKLLGGKTEPSYKNVGKVFSRTGKSVEVTGAGATSLRIGTGILIRTKKGDVPAVITESFHTKSKGIAPNWYERVSKGDAVLVREK